MTVSNADIARIFEQVADLLEIEDSNAFRIRAYRAAARTLATLPQSVATKLQAGEDLLTLPGIGKDLAGKIAEIVETGHLALFDELAARSPTGLTRLLGVPGLGPKRVQQLHEELGIENLEQLASAAEAERLSELSGFGETLEKKILHALKTRGAEERRITLLAAEANAEPLVRHLRGTRGIKEVVVAGSYRRRKETVGDLDILVTCRKGAPAMKRFLAYDQVAEVLSKGTTRSTVILKDGLQVDLRVVPQASYGAALFYFTGSKDHNIAVRNRAVDRGLKINEYGVFKGDRRIAGRSEEEVFASVGLPYIEPELRENRGEIATALKGKLPKLIEMGYLRGDLHAHSKASDGRASIAEMAQAARDLGYDYLSISDHSQKVRIAHGLDRKRLAAQIKEIDRLNAKLDGFTLLKSSEVDILENGKLDLPDAILKELDLAVCAIHSKFELPRAKQTERIIRAMDNPHFTILAHPTGRLLNQRPPYELDMERIMEAAKDRGCFLEVNAQPDRLDLNDLHCKLAKEIGVKLAISTDAHSPMDLKLMRFGVDQARRGWIEADDVINTRPLPILRKLIAR